MWLIIHDVSLRVNLLSKISLVYTIYAKKKKHNLKPINVLLPSLSKIYKTYKTYIT